MKKKTTQVISLFLGASYFIYALYAIAVLVVNTHSLVSVNATVTSFRVYHSEPNKLYPNVGFVYQGDSVFIILDQAPPDLQTGQSVILTFPSGQPRNAVLRDVDWFGPTLAAVVGLWWISLSLYFIALSSPQKGDAFLSPPFADLPAGAVSGKGGTIGRVVITAISGLLIWLAVYLWRTKLADSESTIDWAAVGGVSFVALVAVFYAGAAWFGVWVEKRSIIVDADFVKVIRAPDAAGFYGTSGLRWIIECKWKDPSTGQSMTFTSAPFAGSPSYYNSDKIRVMVDPKHPDKFYSVDLSHVSTTQHTGILLVGEGQVQEILNEEFGEESTSLKPIVQKGPVDQARQGKAATSPRKAFFRFAPALFVIVIVVLIGGGVWLIVNFDDYYHQPGDDFASQINHSIDSLGWTFSFSSMDGTFQINSDSGVTEIPLGVGEFKGQTNALKWNAISVMRTGFNSESNSGESWMVNSPYIRWEIKGLNYLQDGDYVFIADLSSELPASVTNQLKQNFQSDTLGVLGDLHPDADKQSAINYFGELMDKPFYPAMRAFPMSRKIIADETGHHILATNNPESAGIVVNTRVWKELTKTKKTNVSYCLLITSEYVIITAYPIALNIDEIKKMGVAGTTLVRTLKHSNLNHKTQ